MPTTLFSPSWYRVAALKPRLKRHAEIHRHQIRGEIWFVLQDHSTGRFHRFTPAANLIIGLMDGDRSVQEIWEIAGARLGDDLPSQDEIIHLLARLHAADVLHSDVPPDIAELAERQQSQRRTALLQSIRSPFAVRVPLVDPDRFLAATLPLVRPLFTAAGFVVWLAIVGAAVVMAGMHWQDLTKDITDRVLSVDNLVLLLVIFPVVKALHELGHGYAIKVWGGEVHEMGIMFLIFMPIPYVDASAASAFREKWRRVVVGAGGMIVELFVAALAMAVWVSVEPGIVRSIAYNTMLIAGVSTVLFNGNPLLRFDGYYIFSDLIEIPNLGARSISYLGYLVQRYLFRVADLTSPADVPGERGWFGFYAVASFGYRMFVMTVIVLFVATKFFVIGVVLAIWAAILMFVWPLTKSILFLFTSPRLRGHRGGALAVSASVTAVVAGSLLFVPVPYGTVAEGVVWVPERAKVYAATDGFIIGVVAEPDRLVADAQPLIVMEDPIHMARVRVLEAQLKELEVIYAAKKVEDRVQAAIVEEQMNHAKERLRLARERAEDLVVRSPAAGVFLLPIIEDLPGRYIAKGELIGYVVDFAPPTVRVVVRQSDIDLVRQRTERVEVRLADRVAEVLPATLVREIPAASDRLPSVALGTQGGGKVPIDPRAPRADIAFETVFHFEIELPHSAAVSRLGGRVFVRFDHGREALAWQVYRSLRQLFLRRFNV